MGNGFLVGFEKLDEYDENDEDVIRMKQIMKENDERVGEGKDGEGGGGEEEMVDQLVREICIYFYTNFLYNEFC